MGNKNAFESWVEEAAEIAKRHALAFEDFDIATQNATWRTLETDATDTEIDDAMRRTARGFDEALANGDEATRTAIDEAQ